MRITGEPVEVAPNRTDVRDGVGYYFPERSALATNALQVVVTQRDITLGDLEALFRVSMFFNSELD